MATKKTTKKAGTKSSGKASSSTPAKQPVKKKLTAAERKAARASDAGKQTKVKAAPKEKKPKKLSLIDAAVQVLGESKEPMNCKQIVEQVTAKTLWSTDAATPHATLYSAILREIQNKGKDARFKKVDRGQFTLGKGA